MARVRILVFVLLVLAATRSAHADATAFIGATTSPSNRPAKGFAVGAGLLVVGFEFEFADSSEDATVGAPGVKTYMGNVVLQTPGSFYGIQPYFTAGGGVYQESLGARSDTSFGQNLGGGLKIGLIGPVRLRVDYRIFRPGGSALVSPAHRVYVGLNLKF
jgi:hypothetical protein